MNIRKRPNHRSHEDEESAISGVEEFPDENSYEKLEPDLERADPRDGAVRHVESRNIVRLIYSEC
jgi:hypothetical protein